MRDDDLGRLIRQAEKLCECITADESGKLIGDMWVGGNGGLLSIETMRERDELQRLLDAYKQWHKL